MAAIQAEKEEIFQDKMKLVAERDAFRDDLFSLNKAKS
jgi:hypothetical protein